MINANKDVFVRYSDEDIVAGISNDGTVDEDLDEGVVGGIVVDKDVVGGNSNKDDNVESDPSNNSDNDEIQYLMLLVNVQVMISITTQKNIYIMEMKMVVRLIDENNDDVQFQYDDGDSPNIDYQIKVNKIIIIDLMIRLTNSQWSSTC
jgi:hypothetical protein